MDTQRLERAVREILEAVGEDPSREGLLETPPGWPACTRKSSPGWRQTPKTF